VNRCWCLLACLILTAAPAAAQERFYFGGTVAADGGDRGPALNSLGTFPAAGGLVGWRFNDGWSMEVHVDHGFKQGTPHFRLGHFGLDRLDDEAGEGWGVFAVWKSRPLGRIAFAASMGISERRFETTRTVGIDRRVNLPPDDVLLQGETRKTQAAGPTGGFLVPISLGGGWSVAPEVRFSMAFTSEGIYGDGIYGRWYSGARVMWGF
jgi:hypothetical protein